MVSKPTIDALMRAYLGEEPGRQLPRRDGGIPSSLELFRDAMEGYGYQYLTRAEEARWDAARQADDEAAGQARDSPDDLTPATLAPAGPFCRMFGVRPMLTYLDEFFDDYLVRKVGFGPDILAATIDDIRGFLEWLGERGHVTTTQARSAIARTARAADEIPAADRLSHVLYEEGRRVEEALARTKSKLEVIEDYLIVDRVAPGRIWLIGLDGPMKVPEAASQLARPGWTINLVIGRLDGVWRVLEVGNVYPRTLA